MFLFVLYSLTTIYCNDYFQVTRITKIIIGCFVGLTFLAALLLIFFYQAKKRDNPSTTASSYDDAGRFVLTAL